MLPPAHDDCFWNIAQDYLICTTIHKARQLGIFTNEIYVRVSLDRAHKTTRSYARSENPYFNEYFVFELKCTLTELLRLTILYDVKKRNGCLKTATHGELLIDLQSVWNQPNRCFFKKWGRLDGPIGDGRSEDCKGYLQIDLAIVSQSTNTSTLLRPHDDDVLAMNKWQINQDYDDIEKNMLQNAADVNAQCNIRYTITFYSGFLVKKSDYIIQVSFAGLNGKTNVCKNTAAPEFNHEVTFAWTYPSLAQTFLIQLLAHEHLQWKCVAEYELHFEEIAFNDKPALGPTMLHLYDSIDTTLYIGRLLIEVRSECLTADPVRHLITRQVTAMDTKRWWKEETFLIEFVALQGDFLHGNVSNCRFIMKFAEQTSSHVECFLKTYPGAKRDKSSHLKYFAQDTPYKAIHVKCNLPDNRNKFDGDYFMQEILLYMSTEIETFKLFQLKYSNHFTMQTKCFKAIIMSIQNKIKEGIDAKRLEYSGFKDATPWDTHRLLYLQEFFNKLPDELNAMRLKLKSANVMLIERVIEEILKQLVKLCNELKNLLITSRVQDDWPNLLLVLNISGNKEVAICRLNPKFFLSPAPERSMSPHSFCWRIRNFVFKDIQCQHTCLNCGCIMGIVQGCLSVVVESERKNFLDTVAKDWKQSETFYWTPTIPYTIYRCRLFIHQAKVRPGSDRTGLCDAYVRVIFGTQWVDTAAQLATLSPIWNVVVSLEGILMPGPLHWYTNSPPLVVVQIFDRDKRTSSEYLGCGMLAVSVISSDKADSNSREESEGRLSGLVTTKNALRKFHNLKSLSPPPLAWVPVSMNGSVRAEVLMSAELIEMPSDINRNRYIEPTVTTGIPNSIRPIMKNFVLEVVFAGLRNYTKTSFGSRHRIKVMMGDLMLSSGLSSSRINNCINFLIIYASGVVSLPEQLEYWPSIIATDVIVSGRGNETTVGAVLITNSKRFLQRDKRRRCVPSELDAASTVASTTLNIGDVEGNERSLLLPKEKQNLFGRMLRVFKSADNVTRNSIHPLDFDLSSVLIESELSWWTKFYNSIYILDELYTFKHKLVVYTSELEKQPELSYLNDWAEPVHLVHGVKYKKNTLPKEESYATLKLQLKLVPCQCNNDDCGDGAMLRPLAAALNPRYQSELQSIADLCKIIVRVYIVQGIRFRSPDNTSQSDAYVKVQLGSKSICNRAHYVPNQSNPIFGRCFQLEGVLPRDHILEVTVFDRNVFQDNIIGVTYVDLEDRWRSRHRATVGLAKEYSKDGYNKWRDLQSPYELLSQLCQKNDVQQPRFADNTIEIDGRKFVDETRISTAEDLQERLSLTALHHLDILPSFGYKLIPEHVETRSLYHSDCPGIEQGKLQMWIELYEGDLNIPPVMDITPKLPQLFELRLTVLDCLEIALDEYNIFGEKMSDIVVKAWCNDSNDVQSTDVHYRSLNGEGNFNWRMVFPIKYCTTEDMMMVKLQRGIMNEYEAKHPPILHIQIYDNDIVTRDEFLGAIEINLSNFPEPAPTPKLCTLPDPHAQDNFKLLMNFGVGKPNFTSIPKPVNLFRRKSVKGWFPVVGLKKDKKSKHVTAPLAGQAGKIELELELLTEAEAVQNPVGLGRNPPHALATPERPDTSFNPLTHPIKTCSKIIWPAIRIYVYLILIIAILVLVVVQFFSELPYKIIGL